MPGTITFKPIEANLNQKSDIITNADPYCMFSVGDQKIKGQVCKSGGKHPVWEDTITVPAGNQPVCFVELKDKDVMKDDKLGSFEVDLREVETQGKLKKWYPIFLQNRPAGEILMEAVYSPDGMGQGVPVQQGMGMGMPVQQTMMTQQNMMPVQQTLMTQQPMMMPVQQHRVIEMQAAPNVVQETQVYTKETVISMPQQNLVQSQPMYGYDNYSEDSYPESLAEQYAREAMIRGIDPLGTHFHNYPQYNPAMVGNSQIPQNNFGDPNIPASQL